MRYLFIFLFFISSLAFSQSKYSFGAKGGANISALTNFDGKTRTGFYIGPVFNIELSKFVSLQSELTYSQQGEKQGNELYPIELNYLSAGEFVQLYFFKNLPGFHFILGINLDYLLSDDRVNYRVYDSYYDDYYNDYRNLVKIDLDFVGGIGYKFKNITL